MVFLPHFHHFVVVDCPIVGLVLSLIGILVQELVILLTIHQQWIQVTLQSIKIMPPTIGDVDPVVVVS